MKFYKQYRKSYWSNSKVFSWMLPEKVKQSKSFASVDEMIASIRTKDPLIERLIHKLQDIILFPSDLIYSVKIYMKDSKGNTHVLDGGLNKGEWYDLVYRIPVCLFHELEKFIEQEKGLDTHEWEMKLTYDEGWGVESDNLKYGTLTPQALAAIEQNEIYKWWKANKARKDVDFENEEYYLKQEEDMLIRLIRVRNSLWT